MPLQGETFGCDDARGWGGGVCWVLSGSHSVSHTSPSCVTDKCAAFAVYI